MGDSGTKQALIEPRKKTSLCHAFLPYVANPQKSCMSSYRPHTAPDPAVLQLTMCWWSKFYIVFFSLKKKKRSLMSTNLFCSFSSCSQPSMRCPQAAQQIIWVSESLLFRVVGAKRWGFCPACRQVPTGAAAQHGEPWPCCLPSYPKAPAKLFIPVVAAWIWQARALSSVCTCK